MIFLLISLFATYFWSITPISLPSVLLQWGKEYAHLTIQLYAATYYGLLAVEHTKRMNLNISVSIWQAPSDLCGNSHFIYMRI